MSESESDTDGRNKSTASASSQNSGTKQNELNIRIASLQQENRVLKCELETFKIRCNVLQDENKVLRRASVNIQARAEQEEEFISNTLMKKIHELKKEKETLVNKYETEEEFLTNELQRQLNQIRQEKVELEQTLEKEQEKQVNTLMRKIEKLKRETHEKHSKLEELRREKIELENTLEKEQEGLVNRLWKKMDKLETEKRLLQEKLNQPNSAPPSPRQSVSLESTHGGGSGVGGGGGGGGSGNSDNLTANVRYLKKEVEWLRRQLKSVQNERNSKMNLIMSEERSLREENTRLHRQLLLETERREALSRQLSESESSLEMDEEGRHNVDSLREFPHSSSALAGGIRQRSISSPVPHSMNVARPSYSPRPTVYTPSANNFACPLKPVDPSLPGSSLMQPQSPSAASDSSANMSCDESSFIKPCATSSSSASHPQLQSAAASKQ